MLSVNMNAIGQYECYWPNEKCRGNLWKVSKETRLAPAKTMQTFTYHRILLFFEGLTDSSVSLVHRPEL